ncbi:MAG TPA: hypothetical protein PJ982_16875, partial [Lacipirellulaceae bacterium]|nr:hypothetical protein [Lacipirellulaceae bacterium]
MAYLFRLLAMTLALAVWEMGPAAWAEPVDADIVLSGGEILDGSGGPAVRGDVAIRGDRIVAVGDFEPGDVGQTIDCTGLVLAPGFMDLHNHSDSNDSILAPGNRTAENFIRQGCTTMVTGNCGGGKLPVAPYHSELEEGGLGA